MPVRSITRIVFDPDGYNLRLLDWGDVMEDESASDVSAQSTEFATIGGLWGTISADGNARRQLSWSRRQEHASHAAARAFLWTHPALIPWGKKSLIRISIEDGPVTPESTGHTRPRPATTSTPSTSALSRTVPMG